MQYIAANNRQYKYPYFLFGLYITCMLSTVCLAGRLTLVGSMLEPGGIFVFPLTFCICDVVSEVYGYAYPRLFIWVGVLAELIFSLVTIAVSHMSFPSFFEHAHAYQIVFDPTLRYVFSSLAGLIVGEFVNIYLLVKWKIFFKGKFFIGRSLLSTAIGQACLTIVVDILNYFGKISHDGLGWMMICGYAWKMGFAILLVFPSWLLVKHLKKIENIDHYDLHTNFNPFIISLNQEHLVDSEGLPQPY